ncbi:hypothetical protein ACLB2K_028912 [Fragaria x ananassa]
MVRSNSRLSWDLIQNERSRKVTFRKRKTGLLKKAYELNTLCDVKGCVIIYESNSDGQLLQPEIYPKHEEVKQIINKYASCSSKRVHNLEDFYAEKIEQLQTKTRKLRRKNDELQFPTCDDRMNALSLDQLLSLAQKVDHKIEAVRRSMQCAINHEGRLGPMPMYHNGRALPEADPYLNRVLRMLAFNSRMLAFKHQNNNGWNHSTGMTPLVEYAPLTLTLPPNCHDVTFHNHAPPYPMSTSALFPPHFFSSDKLPLSLGSAQQPSLENTNVSSSQSPEDLRRLESDI